MTTDNGPQYFKREWVEQEDGSFIPSDSEIELEPLAQKLRDLAERRDDAGNHIRAQTLRRCAGELERKIGTNSE